MKVYVLFDIREDFGPALFSVHATLAGAMANAQLASAEKQLEWRGTGINEWTAEMPRLRRWEVVEMGVNEP